MPVARFTQGFRWQPIWDLYRDGITFSLLCQFLVCRERFRLQCVYALREVSGFDHKLEYGNMWHAMLENYGKEMSFESALKGLATCVDALIEKHPDDVNKIKFWTDMAHDHFELYIPHYKAMHNKRQPYLQEEKFKIDYVPYNDPQNRPIPLRGKLDEMFKEKVPGTKKLSNVLQENKLKGDFAEDLIEDMLQCDLQTTIYLTVAEALGYGPVDCILYNVIRRPLGGFSSIKQKKGGAKLGGGLVSLPETDEEFQKRAIQEIVKDPDHYFFRRRVYIDNNDMVRFRRRVLDPIMWQLGMWWESIKNNPADPWFCYDESGKKKLGPNPHHWMRPYGIYDSIALGYRGRLHNYLFKGETHTLSQLPDPFPELAD